MTASPMRLPDMNRIRMQARPVRVESQGNHGRPPHSRREITDTTRRSRGAAKARWRATREKKKGRSIRTDPARIANPSKRPIPSAESPFPGEETGKGWMPSYASQYRHPICWFGDLVAASPNHQRDRLSQPTQI